MPSFPVIDSHVHLYDESRFRFSWMQDKPVLDRTHLMADLDRERGAVEIEQLVFVEVGADPGQHLDEAAWAQGLADQEPRIAGIVAAAPLERGAAIAEDLERLAGCRTLCGIRRLIQTESDPSFVLEPRFLEGLRRLAVFDLPFDICLKHWALPYGLELVKRCPDVRFVLDHIGKPDIRHGLMEPWRALIAELARAHNVVCKLSGVITEADHAFWSKDHLKPYVAHVIDCFGFDRVLYGSDWPVAKLTHAYSRWVDILDEIVLGSSESELRGLYRDNAARAYGLDHRA
jgi:L-fuconolactonase